MRYLSQKLSSSGSAYSQGKNHKYLKFSINNSAVRWCNNKLFLGINQKKKYILNKHTLLFLLAYLSSYLIHSFDGFDSMQIFTLTYLTLKIFSY